MDVIFFNLDEFESCIIGKIAIENAL